MEYYDEGIFEDIEEQHEEELELDEEAQLEEEIEKEYKQQQELKKRIKLNNHRTLPILSKYELTRLINERAVDLSNNAPPVISPEEISLLRNRSPHTLAQVEMRYAINVLKKMNRNDAQSLLTANVNPFVQVYLPFVIVRDIGTNLYEEWLLTDFTRFDDSALPQRFY